MRWCLLLLAGCQGFHVGDETAGAKAQSLTLGPQKSCARMSDGTVQCWGNRPSHLLSSSHADEVPFDVRPRVLPITSVVGLSSNLVEDCALHADRTVSCWNEEQAPTAWDSATGSLAVLDSYPGLCVISADRSLMCGSNFAGMQGVNGATDAADATINWTSTCLRHTDGTVACSGQNDQGQLGKGDTLASDDVRSGRNRRADL